MGTQVPRPRWRRRHFFAVGLVGKLGVQKAYQQCLSFVLLVEAIALGGKQSSNKTFSLKVKRVRYSLQTSKRREGGREGGREGERASEQVGERERERERAQV